MIKYEDYRKDKNFKLDSLTYKEIFLGLKENLIKIISDCLNEEVVELYLMEGWSNLRLKYGKDKDLYPLVFLRIEADDETFPPRCFFIEVSPFEIKLSVNRNGYLQEIENEELNNLLVKFMCKHFPNSDYLEKRKKYFKDSNLIKKLEEEKLVSV